MKFIIPFILLVAFTALWAQEEDVQDTFPPCLDSVANAFLDSAFYYTGTTRLDTEFEKKWAADTLFRLSVVDRFLDHPLDLPDSIDAWNRFLLDQRDTVSSIIPWLFKYINAPFPEADIALLQELDTFDYDLPKPYLKAVQVLLGSFQAAEKHIDKMLEDISEAALDSLLMLLPTFWTDSEDTLVDSLTCYFLDFLGHECDTSQDISLDSLYEMIYKIDLKQLGLATAYILAGIEKAIDYLQDGFIMSTPEKPVKLESKWGTILVGTMGIDLYGDATIILDPGGDDVYKGRHACGVIGHQPFGVVIDLGGDDLYDSYKQPFSQACGVFGVGALFDLGGKDIYSCTHYGQGAGLFGSGILYDAEGDDTYTGGVYVQGCGNFGIGALIDKEGEDGYRSFAYAQAFSGPKGFGILLDYEGSDQYFSGGKYSHAPLAPFDYHSFAQGFSIGWRPDVSGGIGLLFDREGNDTYSAGVYSQGVSYWYSLAMLVDNAGNDVYTSVWYPQGSGIHLSVGALVDRAGNDIYVSPQGPGQGSAHDYSVGFFSDYRGDDIYVIDGGNGTSLTNSFALFLDRNGDDLYAKRYQRSSNWAFARGARGTGSLGFFLDLEGPDHYSDNSFADNQHYWFQEDIGFGLDVKGDPFPDPVQELAEEIAAEEPDSDRTIRDIFNDASEWGVGSAKEKADKAFQELLDSAETAAKYICEEQLNTKSGLRLRTIEHFAGKKPELMQPCLFKALHDEDKRRRGNAIYLFGEMQDTAAVDSLLPLLKVKETRISAISALGKIKDTSAVMPIMEWKEEERQSARYMVARALADIGDPRAIQVLMDFLSDDYLTIRIAAQIGLTNMHEHTFDKLLHTAVNTDKPAQLHILRAITQACLKMEKAEDEDPEEVEARFAEARKVILPLLEDKDPVIRGHALRVFTVVGGEETLQLLKQKYELESNRFVRAMYKTILKQELGF
ncbi:HEAT repeat domain-containing protein [bacterium]|nr:HEAT repeat domain-containing protein [bacterium]